MEWPEQPVSVCTRRRGMLACCFAPRVEDEQVAEAAAQQLPVVTHSDVKPSTRGGGLQLTAVCTKDTLFHDVPLAMAIDQDKPAVAGIPAGRRSIDQGLQDLPNLKPLMALSLQRPYTDDDWYAAMIALEKVQRLQQQRALQQLRTSQRISHASFASGHSGFDDDTGERWYDAQSHTMSDSAVSETEWDEVNRLADAMERYEHQQGQLTVTISRELAVELPSCVPNPPLLFADKSWKFCQVDVRPFCAYWERDAVCSTPFPLPIDEALKLGPLQKRTHESVPGMWLREDGKQLLLTAQPSLLLIPGLVSYNEYYNKDSSPNSWTLRRDIKIGKTTGQMFMTTDGVLIFRVFAYGMFSKQVEWIGEDYIRLEDNGETIVTRQVMTIPSEGTVVTQFLIGRRKGTTPPRGSNPGQQQ